MYFTSGKTKGSWAIHYINSSHTKIKLELEKKKKGFYKNVNAISNCVSTVVFTCL